VPKFAISAFETPSSTVFSSTFVFVPQPLNATVNRHNAKKIF
jgi:hypothetical protein